MQRVEKSLRTLIVGDTRSAHNYGSIAVSEAFLNLYEKREINIIGIIDYRSFLEETPEAGHKIAASEYAKKRIFGNLTKIKYVLQKYKLLNFLN